MSLREFVKQMDREKDVLHIQDELSTRFEISHVMKSFDDNGPILFFEKVKGFETKIVANVCGSRKRL